MLNADQFGELVPEEPGTQPVPEGHVRLFHVTGHIDRAEGDERPWHELVSERAQNLRQQGIRADRARGENYGEPSVVWASAKEPVGPYESNVVVEFHHPTSELDIGSGRTPESLEAYRAHVTLYPGRSVPPENVIAVHEPWHEHYRYLRDSPEALKSTLSGEHDDLAEKYPMDYGPAIRRLKKEHGKG